MDRKNININETWDLSLIYHTHDEFYKDLELAKEDLHKLIQMKESF